MSRPRTLAVRAGQVSGWRWPAPRGRPSGSSDAGPRTDQTRRAVNAVISTAPSMCTSTSAIGRSVKYCTKPTRPWASWTISRSRAARRIRPGESVAYSASSSATVSPTSRNTTSACSWLTVSGSKPIRSPAFGVAAVRPAAGDHGAEHQDDGGDGGDAEDQQHERTAEQRLPDAGFAGAQPQRRRDRDQHHRDEEVRGDRPRVEPGQHGDAAEQRLRGDAEEAQRPPAAAGRGGRTGRPTTTVAIATAVEHEGQQPVAELDDAVTGQLRRRHEARRRCSAARSGSRARSRSAAPRRR